MGWRVFIFKCLGTLNAASFRTAAIVYIQAENYTSIQGEEPMANTREKLLLETVQGPNPKNFPQPKFPKSSAHQKPAVKSQP